jgi:hypothetical protein
LRFLSFQLTVNQVVWLQNNPITKPRKISGRELPARLAEKFQSFQSFKHLP